MQKVWLEDPDCYCYLYELEERISFLEENLDQLTDMVFGHIHEWGGQSIDLVSTICVNASIVNEHYEHVNRAVRVII